MTQRAKIALIEIPGLDLNQSDLDRSVSCSQHISTTVPRGLGDPHVSVNFRATPPIMGYNAIRQSQGLIAFLFATICKRLP